MRPAQRARISVLCGAFYRDFGQDRIFGAFY